MSQSSISGGIQPAGGFDPLMSLREQSTAFSGLSSDEVKFREGEVLLSQEQQALVDSFVGKPVTQWSPVALGYLNKQQFRELCLTQLGDGKSVDRSHIKFTFKLEEKVRGQLIKMTPGDPNLRVNLLCRAAAGGGR